MAQPLTFARMLLVGENLMYAVGAFVADFNASHVYNPRWPPHAKFHNGQTMTLGLCLSATSIYFAFKPTTTAAEARDNMFSAALVGSFYCAAGLSAIWYPGTAWEDPESKFQGGGQKWLFLQICVGMWVAYYLQSA